MGEIKKNISQIQKEFCRDINLEQKLAVLVSQALKTDNISNSLYALEDNPEYEKICYSPALEPEFANLLIKEVALEIHSLHDDFSRKHYNEHPDGFYKYVAYLTGKEDWKTTITHNNQQFNVIYLSHNSTIQDGKTPVRVERI